MWPSFNTLLTTKQKPIKIHRLKLYTREWNSLGYNSSDRNSRNIIPQMEMLFQAFSHLRFKTSLNFQAKIILDKYVPRSSDAKLSFILRSEADLPFSLSFIYGGVGERGWKREDERMERSHHVPLMMPEITHCTWEFPTRTFIKASSKQLLRLVIKFLSPC